MTRARSIAAAPAGRCSTLRPCVMAGAPQAARRGHPGADLRRRIDLEPERARPVAAQRQPVRPKGQLTAAPAPPTAVTSTRTAPSTSRSPRSPTASPTTTCRTRRPSRGFAYMPIVAGGTSFMYNLKAGGKRITNLRLSGEQRRQDLHRPASRPGTTRRSRPTTRDSRCRPARSCRSSAPTVRARRAQFTLWMSKQYPDLWNAYCQEAGARRRAADLQLPRARPRSCPGRLARRRRLRQPGQERRHDHLRRVVLRAQHRLPGGQAAQQGGLLRRARRRATSPSAC